MKGYKLKSAKRKSSCGRVQEKTAHVSSNSGNSSHLSHQGVGLILLASAQKKKKKCCQLGKFIQATASQGQYPIWLTSANRTKSPASMIHHMVVIYVFTHITRPQVNLLGRIFRGLRGYLPDSWPNTLLWNMQVRASQSCWVNHFLTTEPNTDKKDGYCDWA